jgi:hypothetical protein
MIVFACDQITKTSTYEDFREGKGDGNYVHNDRRSSQQGSRGGGGASGFPALAVVSGWCLAVLPAPRGCQSEPCGLRASLTSSELSFSFFIKRQFARGLDAESSRRRQAWSVVRRYSSMFQLVPTSPYFLAFSAYITASPNLIKSCKTFFLFRLPVLYI